MRNQKGITLVALVITIIVLLILAGVSISLVMGNNGVLTQASNAVVTNKAASVKESLTTALASAETTYWAKWAQDSTTKRENIYDANATASLTLANVNAAVATDYSGVVLTELRAKYGATGKVGIIGSLQTTGTEVYIVDGTDVFHFTVTVDATNHSVKVDPTISVYEGKSAVPTTAAEVTALGTATTVTLK